MAVTIIIPTPLRQFAGGQSEIDVEATTAGEALNALTTQFADLKKHLYNDQNNFSVCRCFETVRSGNEFRRYFYARFTFGNVFTPRAFAEKTRRFGNLGRSCKNFRRHRRYKRYYCRH